MKVNNFEQIKSLLDFSSSDDFYFIQLLKRKKENPEISHHKSNLTRAIRTYTVRSMEYFNEIEPEIKAICEATKSRAYIHLTRRSFRKTAFISLQHIAERCSEEQYDLVPRIYNTACGSKGSRIKPYYWVVDIDNTEMDLLMRYLNCINECKPNLDENVIDCINTLNGVHIITTPFDVMEFEKQCVKNNLGKIDIHKNNPTVLYYSDERCDRI